MTEKIKNMRTFYKTLGSNTRLAIRITLISIFTLLCISIYTYTATHNPFYYEILSISYDLLSVIKRVAAIGFVGTMILFGLEKNKQN